MKKPRLLLVDQYPDEREMYCQALRAGGFNVRVAEGPEEAFEWALRERPDVVVTRLPQMGGVGPDGDLLRRLKSDARTRSMPVVLLTTMIQPEYRAAAISAGCAAYLLLPALPDDVVREVGCILALRQAPQRFGGLPAVSICAAVPATRRTRRDSSAA
jgi:two-component system phosphate regulon response regulator PhoB